MIQHTTYLACSSTERKTGTSVVAKDARTEFFLNPQSQGRLRFTLFNAGYCCYVTLSCVRWSMPIGSRRGGPVPPHFKWAASPWKDPVISHKHSLPRSQTLNQEKPNTCNTMQWKWRNLTKTGEYCGSCAAQIYCDQTTDRAGKGHSHQR